jgi:tRNA nucleotidyltransferase (CCA-adding enzyme)
MVVDQARRRIDDLEHPQKVTVMLGAVCHDLGKPPTTAFVDGRIRSMEHEQAGVEPAGKVMDRLNVHSMDGYDVRARCSASSRTTLKPLAFFKSATPVGDGAFRRSRRKWTWRCWRASPNRIASAAHGTSTAAASAGSSSGPGHLAWSTPRRRAFSWAATCLELGVPPGPRMGEILQQVYEQQLDGRVVTIDDAIAAARDILAAGAVTQETNDW